MPPPRARQPEAPKRKSSTFCLQTKIESATSPLNKIFQHPRILTKITDSMPDTMPRQEIHEAEGKDTRWQKEVLPQILMNKPILFIQSQSIRMCQTHATKASEYTDTCI